MSLMLSEHLSVSEYACSCCGGLPPDLYIDDPDGPDYGTPYLMLFKSFEEIRERWGGPIKVNSGYRCTNYQMALYKQGKAPSPYSVHVFGLAFDLDCKSADEVKRMVEIAKELAFKLRIGWKQYLDSGQTFIHIDVGQLIYPRFSEKLRDGAQW